MSPYPLAAVRGLGLLGGKATAFNPLSLSPALWLKADAGVYQDAAGTTPAAADTDPVGLWKDQSGNARDFSQALTKRPLLKLGANGINGLATIRFDGSNDILVCASNFSTSNRGTVFIVYRSITNDPPLSWYSLLASGDEISNTRYWVVRGSVYIPSGGGQETSLKLDIAQKNNDVTETQMKASTVLTLNTAYLAKFQSSGTAYAITINGSAETVVPQSGTDNGDWLGQTADRDNFTIGGLKIQAGEIQLLLGDISEIMMFETPPAGADLTNLTNYFNKRYFP